MMFRFIHTGDIHLDSPLRGLAGQQGAAADRIRTATRTAFANLVDYAIEEAVNFFIIAGDLYDGDWRDYQTGLFFVAQMGRLAKAGIPVFLLYGNHDAESQITKRLTLPENVRAFSSRKPETFEIEDLRVALHGQSFRQRDITDNLVLAYPAPIEGAFNIGVLHTGLGGMPGHANYAPCSLDDLVNKGYDYWALAHVHQGTVLHQDPYVVFCGNLQGRHMRETGAKSASVVTVEDGQVVDIAPVEADVVRWVHVPVPVDEINSFSEVIDRLARAIEESAGNAGGRLIACRIELTGRTALHDQLLSSHAQLDVEARAAALALGDEAAWIERVVISTEPEVGAPANDAANAPDDFAAILGEASNDPAFLAQLEAELGELVRKLPHDIRADTDSGELSAALNGEYPALVSEASRYLKARLAAEGA
ncbi:metallophosphoesterase [Methyloceanibacter methanicus]|uniref:Metallophosphoesterase n=1 Tax=Methyloceanibacter methanicus TaxID=1774968 RepID=A0A1E3W1G4_9HYPH|nr:DNA repair exonuclease [Methyloceanibacter methanicus]ODR99361.1 metallophosphoesterase [Methyloceanibacter methanicus]